MLDRDVARRGTGRNEIRKRFALGGRFVAVAYVEAIDPLTGVADQAPPGQPEKTQVLFAVEQGDILEVR